MRKFMILTAAVLIAFTSFSQSRDYEKLLDEIEKSVAASDWALADSLTVKAINADPDNPTNVMLLSNLGMIRFYNGQDSAAIATLTEAHKLAPKSVTILANRARIQTVTGHPKEAIADYDLIEKLDSTYCDTYLYRGLIYLYSVNFENAEKDLKKRERLKPDNEETLVAMASMYSITAKYDEALPYYSKLIKLNPTAEYYAGRAMCHLTADRLMDAADDIGAGMLIDDSYGELYLCRAILNKLYYRSDDSQRDARLAIEFGVSPLRVNALLGN